MEISTSIYGQLANLVLVVHFMFVVAVVGGLAVIIAGGIGGRPWVRHPGWRLAHVAAIGVVVLESWLGILCPLTTLEKWFRAQAGQRTYEGDFIAHWLHQALFFTAPAWVFTLCYTGFGLLVAWSWYRFPPRFRGGFLKRGTDAG